MPATFTIPLITVIPGQSISASLWNGEFENIDTNFIPAGVDDYSATDGQMQTATDPYPGGATSKPTSLQGELERMRYVMAQITGETYWYIDPDISLATVNSKIPINTADIVDEAVTTPKIAVDAVTLSRIADDQISTAKIQNLAITTNKLELDSVITTRIADSAVTEPKLATGAVTTDKIANSNVTKAKIIEMQKFMAVTTSDKTNVTGDGTQYTVIFETEAFDHGGGYDHTTGVFQANFNGYYLLSVNLEISGITSHTSGYIRISTSNREFVKTLSLTNTNHHFSVIADMEAGDVARIVFVVSGGSKVVDLLNTSPLFSGSSCIFSGSLIA